MQGDDVSFKDFLRYIANDVSAENMNEHYMPMTTLCQPCIVNYDFVGIYDNLIDDSEVNCSITLLLLLLMINRCYSLIAANHFKISFLVQHRDIFTVKVYGMMRTIEIGKKNSSKRSKFVHTLCLFILHCTNRHSPTKKF